MATCMYKDRTCHARQTAGFEKNILIKNYNLKSSDNLQFITIIRLLTSHHIVIRHKNGILAYFKAYLPVLAYQNNNH